MKDIKKYFEDYVKEFSLFDSKFDLLEYIVDYGKELGKLNEGERTPENKVRGCTSNVYISCKTSNGNLFCRAESEALIIGGFLKIILDGINNRSLDEVIKNWDLIEKFIIDSGIKKNLTPTRASAFPNIIELLKEKIFNL